uniref:Uncharacterized protein n=1 Tax=Ceratitis capitata TaxID=7213 RepID=W8BVG9_CERCA
MANIWHDKRTFVDENKFASAKLQQTHPRVYSVKKKQVFGELKNVMHNQVGITPLKFGLKENHLEAYKGAKCNDGGVSSKICPSKVENKRNVIDPVELFDLFDFPKSCCTKSCSKSLEEIWAEYNAFDEIALFKVMEKIRSGGAMKDRDEEEQISDVEDFYESEDELDVQIKNGKPYLYMEDHGNDDFSTCAAELPKFDFGHDLLLKC